MSDANNTSPTILGIAIVGVLIGGLPTCFYPYYGLLRLFLCGASRSLQSEYVLLKRAQG